MTESADRPPEWHRVKCWPPFFDQVVTGRKPFEVRKLDRDYQAGDWLWLEEWSPGAGYTGRDGIAEVTFVLAGGQFGIEAGYGVLGLRQARERTAWEIEFTAAEAARAKSRHSPDADAAETPQPLTP